MIAGAMHAAGNALADMDSATAAAVATAAAAAELEGFRESLGLPPVAAPPRGAPPPSPAEQVPLSRAHGYLPSHEAGCYPADVHVCHRVKRAIPTPLPSPRTQRMGQIYAKRERRPEPAFPDQTCTHPLGPRIAETSGNARASRHRPAPLSATGPPAECCKEETLLPEVRRVPQ